MLSRRMKMANHNTIYLALLFQVLSMSSSSLVKLSNGGYDDIVFAINPAIREDAKIIENIKNMVEEASSYLLHASKNRLFIRSAKILIPITWPKRSYTRPRTETYTKADVIIATPHLKNGDDPYTLQYGQCGEKGKYIHFTPNFLIDDILISVYGPRGRVFVHEWAHLRWGVFDEYNTGTPYYISNNLQIEATRCPLALDGIYMKDQCVGSNCKCTIDRETGLYENGCVFLPNKNQHAQQSIMYLQALPDVSDFCDSSNHNVEAPNLQNRMCNYRSTWDVIMNSTDISSTPSTPNTNIPVPTFTLLQASDRVVTLVLDVSGSMTTGGRSQRLVQAAEVFIIQIVEQGSYVGIVEFESAASTISPLVQIFGDAQRQQLKALLRQKASGGTNICAGIKRGLEINMGTKDKSSYGTEIVLLSDGEDSSFPRVCYSDIINSGAIIHAIALGPSAAAALESIADATGGLSFFATDSFDANGLIDAFTSIPSGSGDDSKQSIQLESTGSTLSRAQCLNGTIFIDKTVGNETFFLVTWQTAVPSINLQEPNGILYTEKQFSSDTTTKSSRLQIPGTAKTGPWHYSICNVITSTQAIGITVTSKAVDENVHPITVNAHMNKDTNTYPNPMVIYASVTQGLLPVTKAKVTAIIETASGTPTTLELLDNGAGPDIVKNDGIYSRYFTSMTTNGRYSLKVRVENNQGTSRLALPRNHALYIPGYIENGKVVMNPSRPIINEEDLTVESFSRTASGGSFVVSKVPTGSNLDIYKPEKITDLEAKIKDDRIALSWTATGDDLDQGNATSYDLRMNINPKLLRDNFDGSTVINVSSVTPLPAGSRETFTFAPANIVIENGTILYFALVAIDKVFQKSDVSNIAQAALVIPPTPAPTTEPTTTAPPRTDPTINNNSDKLNITELTLIVCSSVIIICIIISITTCIVSCQKKKKRKSEMRA